jgi:hypothetical protein
MDDNMAPLSNDVVVCGNELPQWNATSPTTLSGVQFEAAAIALGPDHIFSYGMSSHAAPELSFLGAAPSKRQIPSSNANTWLWSDPYAATHASDDCASVPIETLGAAAIAAKFRSTLSAFPDVRGTRITGTVGDWHTLDANFTLNTLPTNYIRS